MALARPDDHRRPVGDLGAHTDITVVPGPRGHTLRERIVPARNRMATGWLAAATVAAGALVADVSLTGRGGATRLLPTTVPPNTVLYPTYLRATGPAAAAPESAFPLRCLSLLIVLHDPSLMNAAFDRNVPCGHPRGPYTLIAIRVPRSCGTLRAPSNARSPRAECGSSATSAFSTWAVGRLGIPERRPSLGCVE
ncbi:MAG TPA: hypothetical protein VEF89_11430 [Solirubrobacteraceae bacterium]|nr:hypothetical protein [Solirubrobacteraceae bacterium]